MRFFFFFFLFFFFFFSLSRSISDHYLRRCGNVTCSRQQRKAPRLRIDPGTSGTGVNHSPPSCASPLHCVCADTRSRARARARVCVCVCVCVCLLVYFLLWHAFTTLQLWGSDPEPLATENAIPLFHCVLSRSIHYLRSLDL